jgi:hypothetical protein
MMVMSIRRHMSSTSDAGLPMSLTITGKAPGVDTHFIGHLVPGMERTVKGRYLQVCG